MHAYATPGRSDSSVLELIAAFNDETRPGEISSLADRLADAHDTAAIPALLSRLGDPEVQSRREVEGAVCGALVALDVMRVCGEGSYAVRPRNVLAPEVVELITELGTSVPMRYLIARQA